MQESYECPARKDIYKQNPPDRESAQENAAKLFVEEEKQVVLCICKTAEALSLNSDNFSSLIPPVCKRCGDLY